MASVQDIFDEINRIENAKGGISEAIEEKGVEVPENAKIQELPPLIRAIPTAVTEIFWAEYGVTTASEIEQAYNAGKLCAILYNNRMHILATGVGSNYIQFAAVNNAWVYVLLLNTENNIWSSNSFEYEKKSNRVTEINQDSDNTHYPSAKAVWDAMQNGKEIFVATYGTTSAADVVAAYNAQKVVVCMYSSTIYYLSLITADYVFFGAANNESVKYLRLSRSNDYWLAGTNKYEQQSNKVSTIEGNESDETKYPNTKAVNDFVVANKQIFWATYGTTTAAEIDQAVAAGKFVACLYNGKNYIFTGVIGENYYLTGIVGAINSGYLILNSQTNAWQSGLTSLEQQSSKVQTLSGNETNESKYPSTKAVADALGKMGVVSQTQTWTGSANDGWTYAMSDIVRGIIPQTEIDKYTLAGATFNATTGYFEMNGLTDLSLAEIREAYQFTYEVNAQWTDIGGNVRTTFAFVPGQIVNGGVSNRKRGMGVNIYYFTPQNLEVWRVTRNNERQLTFSANSGYLLYHSSPKLREIIGCLNMYNYPGLSNNGYFLGACVMLETMRLVDVRESWNATALKRLSLESIVYLVSHSANTTAITITLHATAFARCQADTTTYTYEGQTYTGIIAYAAAKNITIQSA